MNLSLGKLEIRTQNLSWKFFAFVPFLVIVNDVVDLLLTHSKIGPYLL